MVHNTRSAPESGVLNPVELQCVSRVAVVGREGRRSYVEEFVVPKLPRTAPPIYRLDGEPCLVDADGSFIVERTGERLRRVM